MDGLLDGSFNGGLLTNGERMMMIDDEWMV